MHYTLYFPLDQKYSSLYGNKDGEVEGQTKVSRDYPMWKIVEHSMADSTLIALRDGKFREEPVIKERHALPPPKRRPSESRAPSDANQSRGTAKPLETKSDSGDDEDGDGFFEI